MYKFTGSASVSAALGDGDTALFQLQRALTILPNDVALKAGLAGAQALAPATTKPSVAK